MIDSKNIQLQKKYKILLIGDDCEDVYQYGTVDRISPEAPVPVFRFEQEERRPGMAGNVAKNLEALDCEINYLHGETSIKTRLIDIRSKQHIVRIDNDMISPPLKLTTKVPKIYDGIVISDYNKGTVSYELIEELIQTDIPIFIDTKKTDLARMEGGWVKINESEYGKIKSQCSGLIVTLGSRGARAVSYNLDLPAPKVEVADVTGAGDTFLAAFAVEFIRNKDLNSAMQYAIRASSITVKHFGVYAPTQKEIL